MQLPATSFVGHRNGVELVDSAGAVVAGVPMGFVRTERRYPSRRVRRSCGLLHRVGGVRAVAAPGRSDVRRTRPARTALGLRCRVPHRAVRSGAAAARAGRDDLLLLQQQRQDGDADENGHAGGRGLERRPVRGLETFARDAMTPRLRSRRTPSAVDASDRQFSEDPRTAPKAPTRQRCVPCHAFQSAPKLSASQRKCPFSPHARNRRGFPKWSPSASSWARDSSVAP